MWLTYETLVAIFLGVRAYRSWLDVRGRVWVLGVTTAGLDESRGSTLVPTGKSAGRRVRRQLACDDVRLQGTLWGSEAANQVRYTRSAARGRHGYRCGLYVLEEDDALSDHGMGDQLRKWVVHRGEPGSDATAGVV